MIRLIALIAAIITLSGCVSSTPAPVIFHGASDGITKEIVKALKQHPKFEPRFNDILEQYKWIIPKEPPIKKTDTPIKKPVPKPSENNIITQKFIKPVSGKIISTFGTKKDGTKNDGVNIKSDRGTNVKASASGKIIYADDELKAFGNLVLIRHANNIITAYAHLDRLAIRKNDEVKQGDVIGTVGSTGNVVTPQLHFEVRRGSKAVDPKSFVRF